MTIYQDFAALNTCRTVITYLNSVFQASNYDDYILTSFIAIKMVFGLVKLNFSDFFQMSVSPTRGHEYKLYNYRCKSVREDFLHAEWWLYGTAYQSLFFH